ncbi:hypothetical protein ACWEKT_19985 [Nocardia takedensis]
MRPRVDLTPAIDEALTAARAVLGVETPDRAHLVFVGFHDHRIVVISHHSNHASAAPTLAAVSIDTAVLIVLGTPRTIGRPLRQLPRTLEQLAHGGLTSVAVIHCRNLRPGATWINLSDNLTRDGIITTPHPPTPHRRRRPRGTPTRRAVLELIGILAALAILLAAAWILTHPLRTTPCDATAAHSSPARSEAYYIPLSGYAHQTMRTLPGMTWALPHRTSTGHACGQGRPGSATAWCTSVPASMWARAGAREAGAL